MEIILIQDRSHKYPEFIPVHPKLLQEGVTLTAAAVYGDYELAAKQRGVLSITGSLAVERSTREVAHELNLSPAQVKRARKELTAKGLIRAVKQPWGRPSLTVVYTFTLDDDAAPPAGAAPNPAKVAKEDDAVDLPSVSTDAVPKPSPAKKAEYAPAAPPEGQNKGTSVTSSEGTSEDTPAHCLEGAVEPTDSMPVSSCKGTTAAPHLPICAIPPRNNEREKRSLQLYGRYHNVLLTPEEYLDIRDKLGAYAEEYLDHFSSRLNDKRYRCSDHHREILDWWAGDSDNWVSKHHTSEAKQSSEPGHPGNSFDTDDFFDAALKRSFGDDYPTK